MRARLSFFLRCGDKRFLFVLRIFFNVYGNFFTNVLVSFENLPRICGFFFSFLLIKSFENVQDFLTRVYLLTTSNLSFLLSVNCNLTMTKIYQGKFANVCRASFVHRIFSTVPLSLVSYTLLSWHLSSDVDLFISFLYRAVACNLACKTPVPILR